MVFWFLKTSEEKNLQPKLSVVTPQRKLSLLCLFGKFFLGISHTLWESLLFTASLPSVIVPLLLLHHRHLLLQLLLMRFFLGSVF